MCSTTHSSPVVVTGTRRKIEPSLRTRHRRLRPRRRLGGLMTMRDLWIELYDAFAPYLVFGLIWLVPLVAYWLGA
jgi:hypothetical protein